MARVEIASEAWGWVTDENGNGLSGETVTFTDLSSNPATTYSAVVGGTSSTLPLTTNADGTVPGFIDSGQYRMTAGGVTRQVEAVAGSVEARVTDLEGKRKPLSRFPIFGPIGGLGLQLDRLQTTYATPTAFSASSMQIYSQVTAAVVFAQVQFVWTPNATGCGLRLIEFDGGPINIVQVAEATGHTETTPIPSSVDITTTVQSMVDIPDTTPGKFLGWQFKGDGTVGPLVYAVWVDIVWNT